MAKKESSSLPGQPDFLDENDPLPDSMINECIFPIKGDYFAKLVDTEIPSVKRLQCNSCKSENLFKIMECDDTLAAVCTYCNTMIILKE